MRKILKILIGIALFSAVCACLFLGWTLYVTRGYKLDLNKLTDCACCVDFSDANGNKMTLNPEGKKVALPEDIPQHVIHAFIATEDKTFFRHGGISYRRIVKAALNNLKSRSFAEGASTISQQLVKNTQLSGEKTLRRKLREIKLTFELERRLTKDEILSAYLNGIYFGHSAFGIESAAEFYFAKPASELTLAEGATLAAVIRSPNRYSPFVNPTLCMQRRNLVLSLMRAQGYITDAEQAAAQNTPLPTPVQRDARQNGWFGEAYAEFCAILSDQGRLPGEGYSVETYLDTDLQSLIANLKPDGCDMGICLTDCKTGGITAFLAPCSGLKRQPASCIKPLGVYAPCFDQGVCTLASQIPNQPTDFSGYRPKNHDGKYSDYISVREAIAKSANVPAVHLLNALGTDKAIGYLEALGLDLREDDGTLALALGGICEGFTLRELTQAYMALANEGEFDECTIIRRIQDASGNEIYRHQKSNRRVFSKSSCQLTQQGLLSCVESGTARALRCDGFSICAKTGTNGKDGKIFDAYCLSFTTQHTLGVWLGNTDRSEIDHTGGGTPCRIAKAVYQQLYPNEKPSDFATDGLIRVNLDKIALQNDQSLRLADDAAPITAITAEYFAKNGAPRVKSTCFSDPKIAKPTVELNNECINIHIQCLPEYRLLIERHQNGVCTVCYDGESIALYTDSVLPETECFYTVTPYYCPANGKNTVYFGKSVQTEKISTKKGTGIPPRPPITEKNWWEQ